VAPTPVLVAGVFNDREESTKGLGISLKLLRRPAAMSILNDDLKKIDESLLMRSLPESPIAKAMRDLELSPATKAMQAFESTPMAKMMRSLPELPMTKMLRDIESLPIAKKMRDLESSPFAKMLRNIESLPTTKMLRDLKNPLGTAAWSGAAADAALNFAGHFPAFDERIAVALERFSNLGVLHAGEAGISGVGQIEEAADNVVASGSVAGAATHKIAQSALESWWNDLPFDTRILLLVLRWVMAAAATAAIAKGVEAWISSANPQDRQNIYYEITQNVGVDATRYLRCVRASNLKIRNEASSGAAVIDSLPRGTAVEIIESAGAWSLIRYKDIQSAAIREGWAASGYLSMNIC
jgi:Bacterial SH3 domain